MRTSDGLRAALAGQVAPPAPTNDPNFENVSLLLHGDGTNGAQNNTFTDGSPNNFTITRTGNTTQGTFSPFSPTGWSAFFDGTGDYLTTSGADNFNPGSGNWTVEGWCYFTSSSSNDVLVNGTVSGVDCFYILWLGTTFYLGDNNNNPIVVSSQKPINQWFHVAVVKNSTTYTAYINGTSIGSTTTGLASNTLTSFQIGARLSQTWYSNGYISNLRIVKGTAVYTSNFTPPTSPLTAITNTSLLTLQDNRFKDNSTNNFAITRFGDTRIEAFSPFNPTAAYSASTHGGSGYFDGTGDYLTAPANSAYDFGTGNFTVELWFNRVAPKGQSFHDNLVGNRPTGFSSGMWHIYVGAAANDPFTWQARTPAGDLSISGGVCRNTEWNHVAVVRNGNTITLYVNGTAVNSLSTTTSIGSSANTFSVGAFTDGSFPCIGYFSDVRVLKGTALYTSNFTPPTAPLTAVTNTSLLLNFTNAGIIDHTTKNVLETVGNAQISTSVKKFGTGSLALDGTGDYLTFSPRLATAFGTGNFTVECWVYANNTNTYFVIDNRNSSQTGTWAFLKNNNTLEWFSGSSSLITSFSQPTNTWVHIAYSRSGTTGRLFIDGAVSNTWTDSTNYSVVSTLAYIGSRFSVADQLNGYIDDLRITRGVARYTANFTPPTAAFFDL